MRLTILISAVTLSCAGVAVAQAPQAPAPVATQPMERVDGIGGFFFRSTNPKALAQWYADHLGVTQTPTDYNQQPWRQEAGPTVFEPFPADSKFFERTAQTFILNFRVKDLDAMVAQLRRAGIAVDVDPQTYPNGRFALTHDPEGNPIQLWQPKLP